MPAWEEYNAEAKARAKAANGAQQVQKEPTLDEMAASSAVETSLALAVAMQARHKLALVQAEVAILTNDE